MEYFRIQEQIIDAMTPNAMRTLAAGSVQHAWDQPRIAHCAIFLGVDLHVALIHRLVEIVEGEATWLEKLACAGLAQGVRGAP